MGDPKKRVHLRGWFCQGNSGDDALFVTVASALREAAPDAITTLRVPEHSIEPPFIDRVETISSHHRFKGDLFLRDVRAVFGCRLLVWGGGSFLFDSDEAQMRALRYTRFLCRIARLRRIPIVFASIGVGPFKTREGTRVARAVLNMADLVQVRDSASYRLCRDLKIRAQVEKGFDPAVLLLDILEVSKPPRTQDAPFTIGVSLSASAESSTKQERKIESLAQAVRRVAARIPLRVAVIQMCAHPIHDDMEGCRRLTRALEGICETFPISYCPNPAEMMNAIAGLDAIIAERLHAAVYAYSVGVPFAIVSHHGKCLAFAEDVGLPNGCILDTDISPDRAEQFLECVVTQRAEYMPSLPVEEAKDLARKARQSLVDQIRRIVG